MRKSAPPINIINANGLLCPFVDVAGVKARAVAGFARVGNMIHRATSRARQRRDLAALDARQLRDIGVSRTQARDEAEKPFWRA